MKVPFVLPRKHKDLFLKFMKFFMKEEVEVGEEIPKEMLYVFLAYEFGWTPSQVDSLDRNTLERFLVALVAKIHADAMKGAKKSLG